MTTEATEFRNAMAEAEIRTALSGKRCWHAYVSAGSTFGLDLGRKLRRDPCEAERLGKALDDRVAKRGAPAAEHEKQAVEFKGESHMIVWCTWRLDGPTGPLASSDLEAEPCQAALEQVVGKKVQHVTIGPGWELSLAFSTGLLLSAFPDHVGPGASIDTNWELWRRDRAYFIREDLSCEVLDSELRPLRPQAGNQRWKVAEDVAAEAKADR